MYLSIDAAKRYIFYSSIKFQKLTIQLFYQTYDPLIYFELSIIILIYHMQYNICISMQGILILIFQKSGIKVSRNNCFIFCSKKRDESTIEEDRTIYIYIELFGPWKSIDMCHDAPKASLKTHRMHDGVLHWPTGIVSSLPLSSDRHVECWMHINLCPISEFPASGESLFLSSFLSSLFVLPAPGWRPARHFLSISRMFLRFPV